MLTCFSRFTLLIAVSLILTSASYSNNRRPAEPPAQSPNFHLLLSEATQAVVQYTRSEDDPFLRTQYAVYVGIPVDATYEIQYNRWDAALTVKRQEVGRIVSDATAPEGIHMPDLLNSLVQVQRFSYQELDVLQVQISTNTDSPNTRGDYSFNRDKIVLDRLEFTVRWQGGESRVPETASTMDAGYNRLFHSLLINAKDAQALRRKRSLSEEEKTQGLHAAAGYSESLPVVRSVTDTTPRQDAMRVRARQEGMTAIRALDISQQGLDPKSVKLDQARLWDQGAETPLFIQDDGDGVLGETDALYFYAAKTESEYSNDRIYTLTWSAMDTPPLRVQEQTAMWAETGMDDYLARTTIEEDHVLVKERINEYAWYYKALDQQDTILPLDLTGLTPSKDVQIKLRMINNMRSKTDVNFVINDLGHIAALPVGEVTEVVLTFPAQVFVENATLQVSLESSPEGVSAESRGMSAKAGDDPFIFIDTVEVLYPRRANPAQAPVKLDRSRLQPIAAAVQIENGTQPQVSAWLIEKGNLVQRLSSTVCPATGYFQIPDASWEQIVILPDADVPSPFTMDLDYASTLHSPNQGHDYLIIAHESLMAEARRLEGIRRAEGFDVLLVDVQDIYDEFNYGYPHSDAIKRFLRYAQAEWKGLSPEFAVFIGDSSWDHKDREGTDSVDQVPTYAPEENPQKDGSDEWYAYLWGGTNDYYSDLIVGRISVRKSNELANYIDKLVKYENESPVGLWKIKNLFITDDTFETYSRESAQESLPPQFVPGHIDQVDFAHVTNPYLYHRFVGSTDPAGREYTNKKYCPDCTLAILEGFNQGALIVQYIGHGGNQIWSHERIFYGTDRPYSNVLELNPNNKFPFIINWSCLTGYLNFNVPPFNVCLAEEFIRYADKGGIAMWAPSGSGSTDQHMLMTHIVNRGLIKDGLTRLGEAATHTKVEYLQIQYHPDLMGQYILFGDPGVKIATPKETLAVTAQPGLFVSRQESTYQIESKVQGFAEGQAVVSLSVDGEMKYRSEPFDLADGAVKHEFTYAFGEVKYSTAAISVYAWNEAQNLDAWGGTTLQRREPEFLLNGGQVETGNGESVVRFEIGNHSSFDAAPVDLHVNLGDRDETLSIAEVPAGATVTAEWKGALTENVRAIYVSVLSDPLQGIADTKPDKRLMIPVNLPSHLPVVPLIGKVGYSTPDLISETNVRFTVPFMNFDFVNDVTAAAYMSGPGSATDAHEIQLRGGEVRSFDFLVDLPDLGEHEYTLTVQWNDQSATHPIRAMVWGKPDLALAEGDFTITPAQPLVGKTVVMKTTVYNMGEGPATDINIAAFDGDPAENRRLQSFNNRRQPNIKRLEPGESQEVEIVWDPASYEGLGLHEIYLVVDSYERVRELSEQNNRIHFSLSLANLPDLSVDPWMDLDILTPLYNGLVVWGQPLTLYGRVRNIGESDAEYVRLTLLHNNEELAGFFPIVPKNGMEETTIDVPLVSAKNTLRITADKYDLIGEMNEKAEQLGNNLSHEKRLYLQVQMPEAPVAARKRVYRIESETQFSAGLGEYVIYDQKQEGLRLHNQMNNELIRILPSYVQNPEVVTSNSTNSQWHWSTKFNSFLSPTHKAESLRLSVPAPNGIYDVYLQLYSPAYEKNATATIQYKTGADIDYVTYNHQKNNNPRSMHKLGTYHIKDDKFPIEFRAVPNPFTNTLGDLNFVRTEGDSPIAAGYLSPFFPASGSGTGFAELAWEAETPEGTQLLIKARWVNWENNKAAIRYAPWSRVVESQEGKLRIPGKGDFLQYHVNFVQIPHEDLSPLLKNVTVTIPAMAKSNGP